jgi:hypothetical protein
MAIKYKVTRETSDHVGVLYFETLDEARNYALGISDIGDSPITVNVYAMQDRGPARKVLEYHPEIPA